jgi:hypothetical protein
MRQEQAQSPPLPPSILTALGTPATLRWAHPGSTAGRAGSSPRPGSTTGRRDLLHAARRHRRSAGSAHRRQRRASRRAAVPTSPLPTRAPQILLRRGGVAGDVRWAPAPPAAAATPRWGAAARLVGLSGRRALPCLGLARHDQKGLRAGPGLEVRPGGPTRPDTKRHRACIVSGRIGPG